MKNLFFLCMILLSYNSTINAQAEGATGKSKFNLHLEAGSLVFVNSISLNFERKLFSSKSEKINWYGRTGLGYVDVPTLILCDGQHAAGGLVGLTMLTGKGNNHFELYGGTFLGSFKDKNNDSGIYNSCSDTNSGLSVLPLVDVGYRYQKPEGGFVFRAKIGLLGIGIGIGSAF